MRLSEAIRGVASGALQDLSQPISRCALTSDGLHQLSAAIASRSGSVCLSVWQNDPNQQFVYAHENAYKSTKVRAAAVPFASYFHTVVYASTVSAHAKSRNFETPRSPTTNINSATLKLANHESECEREETALRQCMHPSEGTVNATIQTNYTRVCERNLYCEKFESQPAKIQQIDGQTICRSRWTSLQRKRIIGMWSSVYICSVFTSGEAIWNRSNDGLSWSFDGEVETRRGGYSRRGVGIDKCHAALISFVLSSPACPAQTDTHGSCWSALCLPNREHRPSSCRNPMRSVRMHTQRDKSRISIW